MTASDKLAEIYAKRFDKQGHESRERIWRLLCRRFFDRRMETEGSVLELGCGHCEFINNIDVRTRYAVDLNPDSERVVHADVIFRRTPADQLAFLDDNSIDRIFTSNFLEHLHDKRACDRVLTEALRVLKPGGHFIALGPNIRYVFDQYWDFYDHYLPLSHVSLAEGLEINGFEVIENIPRFLPYSMQSKLPTADVLIIVYLRMRLLWPLVGKQFLITARKP